MRDFFICAESKTFVKAAESIGCSPRESRSTKGEAYIDNDRICAGDLFLPIHYGNVPMIVKLAKVVVGSNPSIRFYKFVGFSRLRFQIRCILRELRVIFSWYMFIMDS